MATACGQGELGCSDLSGGELVIVDRDELPAVTQVPIFSRIQPKLKANDIDLLADARGNKNVQEQVWYYIVLSGTIGLIRAWVR
jgi:hypothetical protein